jgi:hypothetical protein
MRTAAHTLPPGLQEVAGSPGLEFPVRNNVAGMLPLACPKRELMTEEELRSCPVQPNFQAISLDTDNPQDVIHYQNIMGYNHAKYGMQIVHLERRWVTKTKTRLCEDGTIATYTEDVMRIYLEYYAPYRVLTHNNSFS